MFIPTQFFYLIQGKMMACFLLSTFERNLMKLMPLIEHILVKRAHRSLIDIYFPIHD